MSYSEKIPVIALVPTVNPPAAGLWLWAKDWKDVERLDKAIHHWSMKQLLKRSEEA